MDNFSIEVVVFGVLILVIVLDLLIKGRKKKQDIQDESNLIKGKETTDAKKSSSVKRFFNYLIERPRNLSLFIIVILIVKVLISFILSNDYGYKYNPDGKLLIMEVDPCPPPGTRIRPGTDPCFGISEIESFVFVDHIKLVFNYRLTDFLFSLVVISFITWQLNPFIKKR